MRMKDVSAINISFYILLGGIVKDVSARIILFTYVWA